ncbi:MAG: flagellar hook-length control protein FliK [Spirochaetales bacterium]|nr:flagellar hook-length control protein FliK [Spirochaetales bacterium]
MPISQIAAVDFSTIPFTDNHAAEIPSNTGDEFSTYLARIMDPQDQQVSDDRREAYEEAPNDPVGHSSAPTPAIPTDSEQSSYDPDGRSRIADAPKEHKPSADDSIVSQKEPALALHGAGAAKQVNAADFGPRREPGGGPATIADLKAAFAGRSAAGEGREDPGRRSTDSTVARDNLLEPVAKSGVPAQELTAIDKPDTGRIAEIDVVLENASRSGLNDVKGPAMRGRQGPVQRDSKGVSAASTYSAADRMVMEAASEERSQADRKTRIVVRDLRERTPREADAGNTASEVVKSADGAGSGTVSGNDSQSAGDQSFSSLLSARPADPDTVVPRMMNGTTQMRTNSGVLQSLRQTLDDQVNGEIVRTARMVVRGNDTGEIRLHLKPESLGNVRIVLQMQEGHIAGRIIVENSSVREIFEQNLASLIEAFNESGLETGTLDVALANSGSGSQRTPDGGHAATALRELDHAVPLVEMLEDDHDLVDLVV